MIEGCSTMQSAEISREVSSTEKASASSADAISGKADIPISTSGLGESADSLANPC
jgi:hypothetical protein